MFQDDSICMYKEEKGRRSVLRRLSGKFFGLCRNHKEKESCWHLIPGLGSAKPACGGADPRPAPPKIRLKIKAKFPVEKYFQEPEQIPRI
jgi:hypothetical protein